MPELTLKPEDILNDSYQQREFYRQNGSFNRNNEYRQHRNTNVAKRMIQYNF